jgi:virginiamycin A acetyltransferase
MRGAIKYALTLLCFGIVSPLAVPVWLCAPFDRQDKLFQFGSQLMSLFPGLPGDYLRQAYYRWLLNYATTGPIVSFGSIFAQRDTTIGDRVYIGAFCNLGSSSIGNDVLIGSNVIIASPKIHAFDRTDVPISQQGGHIDKISIGDGAWLGNGCIVLNDVGAGAIVAAGAVVVKKCDRFGIYGGNPAKLIRSRLDD